MNTSIRGSEIKPGQTIMSAHRWYTVTRLFDSGNDWSIVALVTDTRGRDGQISILADEDYPVKAAGGQGSARRS